MAPPFNAIHIIIRRVEARGSLQLNCTYNAINLNADDVSSKHR